MGMNPPPQLLSAGRALFPDLQRMGKKHSGKTFLSGYKKNVTGQHFENLMSITHGARSINRNRY